MWLDKGLSFMRSPPNVFLNPSPSEDNTADLPNRPITRALKKLINFKNAASMAVSLIQNEIETECDCNLFTENYNKYHCKNCYNVIQNFAHIVWQSNIVHSDLI